MVYLGYILLVVILLWALAPRVERIYLLAAIVTMALAIGSAITMREGVNAGRHLMIFNHLLDLIFFCDIVFAVYRWRGYVGFH